MTALKKSKAAKALKLPSLKVKSVKIGVKKQDVIKSVLKKFK